MSRFFPESFPCPKCGKPVQFGIVASVNASRRPDFRQAILDGTFQCSTCPECSTSFRIEPELTYLDSDRKQWILVQPAAQVADWPVLEEQARQTFDRAYGATAGAAVRELGASLQARITFGWAALREKILCVEHALDDVTLELLKVALVRSMDDVPLRNQTELRLMALEGEEFLLSWLVAEAELPLETMRVPRSLYDEILAAPADWNELKAQVSAGPFVDFKRLILPADEPQDAEIATAANSLAPNAPDSAKESATAKQKKLATASKGNSKPPASRAGAKPAKKPLKKKK